MFRRGKGGFFKYWIISNPNSRSKIRIVVGSDSLVRALKDAELHNHTTGDQVTVVEVKGTYSQE